MFTTNIQPASLYSNSAKPIEGLDTGLVFNALHPLGFSGDFRVMHIQASETIGGCGLVLRQEFGVQGDEAMDAATGGSLNSIVDTTHGIATTLIDDDSRGFFYYIDDAVAGTADIGTPEIGEVKAIEDADTIRLVDDAADAVANADNYQIWRPGRMKLADDDATIPNWGVSCRSLTDEYYGFMVIAGYWMAQTSASTGDAFAAGDVVVSDATAGKIQKVTAGTSDSLAIGQAVVGSAADDDYVPIIVRGWHA